MIPRIQLIILLTGLMAFTSSGCKKRSETAATGGTMTAAGEVAISTVELGRRVGSDKRIADATTTFSPRDTIYASVVTDGAAPGATITARWTFEDNQVVKEDSRTIAPSGAEATEFHITKPSGWPKGKYKATFALGGSTKSKDFEVK